MLLLMADLGLSLSICVSCGFKGPERKTKVDPRLKGSGRSWGEVPQVGYVAKACTSGWRGSLRAWPAPPPGRAAAGGQLSAAFSAAHVETNDDTEEE